MKRLGVAVVVLLNVGVGLAGTLEDARTALADRRFADAAAILEKLQVETDDYRLYLLATARHLGGEHEKAIAVLDQLLAKHPKSSWRSKALCKKADALGKLGRFAAAEQIYEEQVVRLASTGRRGEIARVYLSHADQAFEPKRHDERPGAAELEDRKPDYKAALKLYQRAQELDALPDEADRIALRIGLCHAHLKQHDEAIAQFDAFLKKHEQSKLVPDALYHQGLAYIEKGDPDRARASFEKLLRDHPDGERAPEALYKVAATYGLPKPGSEGDLSLGAKALRAFVAKYPKHKLAPKAGFELGFSYFQFRQFSKAIEEFSAFVKQFGDQKDAIEVGRAAKLIGDAQRALNRFDEAVAAWEAYLRQFPAHEDWQKAQAAIVSARYDQAMHFFRKKQWDDAEKAFRTFAATYPLDGRNANALYMLGEIPFRQEKWQDAVTAWRRVVSKFPKTKAGQGAQFRIAGTLDRKLHEFEQAIEEYKKIKEGPFAAKAAQRLGELKEPHLLVTFEKIVHTDQKPTLKVASRNIEKIHFKAYRLNAEDYFRRMGGLERIEALDIALIDPHHEWDEPIKDYKQYEDIESQIELKLEGAGLFAIHASTEKLEATLMVLVTDLGVLVKSSKKDVLVFAQNLRTGKPQPGARLLVSDGRKVVLEGRTGDDGVWQGASDELKDVAAARVYAVADGSPASNALDISGLGVALGLQPRGLLYTDRPAYRPGEKVSYRGLLRLVEKGSYATGAGKEVKVRVHSARGDVVHEATHKLSEFGTLSGQFTLNEREPFGEYRLVATLAAAEAAPDDATEERHTFTGQFRVDEYQLPLYKVEFDLAKPTFFRGEKIEGKIRVEYYFGQPVAGKDVRYRLRDQRWHSKTTDEKGEVAFEFESDFFRQTEVLPLVAILPADGVAASKNILLTTTEYQAKVSTLRGTYLVGEPFDAKVKTTDFDNKPVAREVTVGLYRFVAEEADPDLILDEGADAFARVPRGFVEVEKKTVTTAKDTGEAVVQLTGKEGGHHLIRVEGRDGRDNLVVAERPRLFISGEDDKIKLRLLTDSDEYRVGERPEVNVVCRVGPALGLLTWEGERIYRYRLVQLRQGTNRIPVEIPDECAPNFTLGAAVLHENEFHQFAKHLAVLKHLTIALEPSKKELAPGEEVTVKVKTTDQAGKPVAAELSLAVVDEALYARYADGVPSLGEFFHQRREGAFFAMAASNGFKYQGVTRAASTALRRERERVAQHEGAPPTPPVAAVPAQPDVDGALEIVAGFAAEEEAPEAAGGPAGRAGGGWGYGGETGGGKASGHYYRFLPIYKGAARGDLSSTHVSLDALAVDDMLVAKWYEPININTAPPGALGALFTAANRREAGVVIAGGKLLDVNGNADFNGPAAGQPLRLLAGVDKAPEKAGGQRGRPRTALVRLRDYFPQTAYWHPAITTDAKGEASVSFVLPDTTTGWRLVARGISAHHLVGETTASVVTRQPFSLELAAPAALTAGDKASVRASVRNFTNDEADAALAFTATIAGKAEAKSLRRTVAAGKVHEESFGLEAKPGAQAELKLEGKAGEHADAIARTVPIRPWGVPVRVGASGSSKDTVTLDLVLPADRQYVSRSLTIAVSASLPRHIIDAALRAPTRAGCTEQTIGSGLVALCGIEMLDRMGAQPTAERARLGAVVDEAIRTLTLTQRDGGWTWAFESRHRHLDPFVTAYALEFLRRAERKGFAVPKAVSDAARQQARKLFSAATTHAEKAALLYGLSFWGDADFSYVHRLDRLHPQLDNQSLALLVLTFLNLDREARATELAKVLVGRSSLVPLPVRPGKRGRCWLPQPQDVLWRAYPIESTALAVEAVQRTMPRAPELAQAIEWLMDHRIGAGWGSARATASAVRALTTYVGETKAEPQKYTLDLVLNGTRLRTLAADGMQATVRVEAPADRLQDRNRLDLKLNGRGEFAYTITLEGITDGIPQAEAPEQLEVKRRYGASPLLFEGVEIPRGYGVIRGEFEKVENPCEELPEGKTCDVHLDVYPRERQRYLVVEDYLPAGTSVVESTLRGGFDRYELGDGRITFYFSNRDGSKHFSVFYRLAGRFRGQYRVLPARAYSFYQPYELVVGAPGQLAVLAKDGKPKRDYRMTPDELYHLGKKHYEAADSAGFADKAALESAQQLLSGLFREHRLKDAPFKDTARMLLYIALANNDAKAVVDYFEILKERYPELVIPFDKIVAVAKAYRDRGEHERAVMVFRAIAEGFYFQEANVAGVLEGAGDFIAAAEFLEQLLAEYPDLPVVQTGLYSLAQQVYSKLPELETNERLRKRVTRAELLKTTRGLLQRFLALYPDNPIADEVSFALASSYLEDESYPQAIDLCAALQKRYPESPLLDSFEYIAGYGYFVTDRPEEALELCRKVATGRYRTRDRKLADSDDRWNAIHMIAQVYHAQRQHQKAIEEYGKVKTHFADAREALAFLQRRHLELPEVTTIEAGEKPEVELTYRNIASADLKVYRVDLMTLYLLERNLSEITRINLAGIKPHVERTLKLGEGKDYIEKKHTLPLPELGKPGAYLIVCKSEEVECSGMCLVTTLQLQVQQDAQSGRLRVTARDHEGRYERKVHVKVIGSGNEDFKSGETDLRGVYEAAEVRGLATVIARKGDNYAFHRGQVPLLMGDKKYTIQYRNGRIVVVHSPEVTQAQEAPPPDKGEPVQDDLGNIKRRLSEFQGKSQQVWEEQTTAAPSGVAVERAF